MIFDHPLLRFWRSGDPRTSRSAALSTVFHFLEHFGVSEFWARVEAKAALNFRKQSVARSVRIRRTPFAAQVLLRYGATCAAEVHRLLRRPDAYLQYQFFCSVLHLELGLSQLIDFRSWDGSGGSGNSRVLVRLSSVGDFSGVKRSK